MKSRSQYGRIFLAILALFLVQATCVDSVDRKDPRILESVNQMSDVFIDMLYPLQISPATVQLPPMITQIGVGPDNNTVTVSGKSRNDPFEMVAPSGAMDAKIRLYRIKLNGCGQEPERIGESLAEIPVLANRDWTVEIKNLKPDDVIGATQVFEGKETGLSNLKSVGGEILKLDNADKFKDVEYFLFGPVTFTGNSIPGACVVVVNRDPRYGRETSNTVGKDNIWKAEVQIRETDNQYRIYVEGWDDIAFDLSLRGSNLILQWPYKDRDQKEDGSCNYIDTEDKQEPRIEDCYYKFAISTWYGRNDYYVQSGRVGGFHNGIDIAGSANSYVYAVAKGNVFYVNISESDGTGGNYILIDHGSWVSAYMHLSAVTIDGFTIPDKSELIKQPIKVDAGQKIGETGKSGCSTCGVHLHFSAFQWANGYREASLKENTIPAIPWARDTTALKLLNVNPPAGKILGSNIHYQTREFLGSGESSTDRLADRRDPKKPEEYFSNYDYWQVNWNEIRIQEYGCASGTKFDELAWGFIDKEKKKEGWICQ